MSNDPKRNDQKQPHDKQHVRRPGHQQGNDRQDQTRRPAERDGFRNK